MFFTLLYRVICAQYYVYHFHLCSNSSLFSLPYSIQFEKWNIIHLSILLLIDIWFISSFLLFYTSCCYETFLDISFGENTYILGLNI